MNMHSITICKAVAVGAMLVSGPLIAARPSDQIYQVIVQNETLCTPAFCASDCAISEGRVPYLLAELTITHKGFAAHRVQWSNMTDPVTDDGEVVSFESKTAGTALLTVPLVYPNYCPPEPPAFSFDLGIVGKGLGGSIVVQDICQHGDGCALSMNGTDGNWSGTWWCGSARTASLHSFTAMIVPVEPRR